MIINSKLSISILTKALKLSISKDGRKRVITNKEHNNLSIKMKKNKILKPQLIPIMMNFKEKSFLIE